MPHHKDCSWHTWSYHVRTNINQAFKSSTRNTRSQLISSVLQSKNLDLLHITDNDQYVPDLQLSALSRPVKTELFQSSTKCGSIMSHPWYLPVPHTQLVTSLINQEKHWYLPAQHSLELALSAFTTSHCSLLDQKESSLSCVSSTFPMESLRAAQIRSWPADEKD